MSTKKHPRKTFSLEVYARIWAMLVAISRADGISIGEDRLSFAYSAYVEGRTNDLSTAVESLAHSNGLQTHRGEILKRWKKLDQTAKRETSRRAFQS